MALNKEERQKVKYFTGIEVEHTAAYGLKTLFVVGTPPLGEILAWAKTHHVDAIYFGTSQTFHLGKTIYMEEWNECILGCLRADYYVTLDYDIGLHDLVMQAGYNKYEKFIPMISAKLANIDNINNNAVLKIDDTTWGDTNPGVWTHKLSSLQTEHSFTPWTAYEQDDEI